MRGRQDLAKLLALAASLAAAIRALVLTAAALGQICNSQLAGVSITLIPLVQLAVIGAGEGQELTAPKRATALYLAAAALLVAQQLLIASC